MMGAQPAKTGSRGDGTDDEIICGERARSVIKVLISMVRTPMTAQCPMTE
jgi:hypothetical protein